LRTALCALAVAACLPVSLVSAETIGGNPGPAYNYICPNSDGKPALDCYFDAVTHLYTMCKHVKSIEIIEFGYEKSDEGLNNAKSESCLVKQKLNMTRPYQAALKAVTGSREAVDDLRALNELWLKALSELEWRKGETDEQYKARTLLPFESFAERIVAVQTAVQRAALPATKTAARPATKTKAKAKAAAPTGGVVGATAATASKAEH
jgi:hypothetical protein